MPLLGPLSDRVAWNEVLRRTPQINQAVAEDVSRDVLPKINRLIDEDFASLQKMSRQRSEKSSRSSGVLDFAGVRDRPKMSFRSGP